MNVQIEKSCAFGRAIAPPSKSVAHRLLICAALSMGKSEISNLAFSDDIKATISCLESLGAKIKIEGSTATVYGIDFKKEIQNAELYCNESGSTLRFLIPICSLFSGDITLRGSERLFSRSLSVYEALYNEQGIIFKKGTGNVTLNGRLTAGKFSVKGDISSQFISGLLFVLPLLDGDSIIEINSNIESGSYINLTIKALASFGVRISRVDEKTFLIKGNQTYKPQKLSVEGDFSNAAFIDVFNYLGGNVLIEGLNDESIQGDKVYKNHFKTLKRESSVIDIVDCPDLAPILMAFAAANHGVTLIGTHRLKIKESDRGVAMATELSKFGIKTELFENKIVVHKGTLKQPKEILNGHNDHRIVMSLSVLCSITGGEISGAQAVNKSYPNYFSVIENLGIKIKVKN